MPGEGEAERSGATGFVLDRLSGATGVVDREQVDQVVPCLGHDEVGSIRSEPRLGRKVVGATHEHLGRPGQRRQFAVWVHGEPGDIRVPDGRVSPVEYVDQIVADGHADRDRPTGGDAVDRRQFLVVDCQDGDLVTAHVDGEQETVALAQRQGPLRRQGIQ